MNSGEAFVNVIANTIKKDFGNVKIGFDISCVLISVILSLLMFDFTVIGVREGTVLSAVLAGSIIKFFRNCLNERLTALCVSL